MVSSAGKFWERLPFVGRLLFTASTALVIAGAVMLYTSARWDAQEMRADLESQLRAELQTVPPSLAEILVIGDFSTLQQTLDSYVRRANVSAVSYRDVSGSVVESRDTPAKVEAPAWFAAWLGLETLSGEADAEIGGRKYGTLRVSISAQEAVNRAWFRLVQHLSILLLAIVLDFIGIWLVLRSGLKPLNALNDASLRLGHGDRGVRLEPSGAPEMQAAAQAFNEMAARIDMLVNSLQERERQLNRALDEQRQAQDNLRRLNDTLEQRVHQETTKNREKDHLMIQQSRLAALGEMIGNIAHQWRQPLNTIGLLFTNIKDAYDFGDLDEQYLEECTQNGMNLTQQMSATIDDFRNFFRPNREKVRFSLNKAIREALAVVEAGYGNDHIELVWQVGEDVSTEGFPSEYSQVLLNLLANARDAILGRQVAAGRVTIMLVRDGKIAILSVRDNGGGIPDEVLPKVFDPYFTTKEKGTGIGLYMSKMIIENNMNGRIEARNNEGGAEFAVITPLAGERA
jgi:signal transduction histidine kinase